MKALISLPLTTQYFLLLTFILVPILGVAGYFRYRSGKPLRPKRERYRAMIVTQCIILLITISAAQLQHIELLGRSWGNPAIWVFALVYFALLIARVRKAWTKLSPQRLENARRLLPDDPTLMRLWVGVAAMASISEECAYRGMAPRLLMQLGLHLWLAILLCVLAFAIGHMTQGWRGVLATAILALMFHGLVFATGSLYLAIVIHAVYNLSVGVIAVPILSRTVPVAIAKAAEA